MWGPAVFGALVWNEPFLGLEGPGPFEGPGVSLILVSCYYKPEYGTVTGKELRVQLVTGCGWKHGKLHSCLGDHSLGAYRRRATTWAISGLHSCLEAL